MDRHKKRKRDSGDSDPPGLLKGHRFVSFSERIANFKVEPVFRQRNGPLETGSQSATASLFQESLEEWKDLNTSSNFTNFVREISPLCNSLPQVLHFEDTIFGILTRYIEKKDALSLEPLLKLTVQLARDLGVRFEKYFGPSVALLAALVAGHPSADVIEWGFNCLACLFKFLSKLLVPDLRPTYDLMAPLLGREHQKSFVMQFAAEAMAHLTRKAAALSHKNEQPLRLFLEHVFADLHASKGSKEIRDYQHGLILMFSAAAKGVKGAMHSCAASLLGSMFETIAAVETENMLHWEEVLRGTVMLITYHVQVDAEHPAIFLAHKALEDTSNARVTAMIRIASSLLLTAAGVKKGTRVVSWPALLNAIERLLKYLESEAAGVDDDCVWRSCMTAATVLHRGPLDSLLPRLSSILDILAKGRFADHFMAFCSFTHQLGPERFQALLLSPFKRFIVDNWLESEAKVCLLLPKVSSTPDSTLPSAKSVGLACPPDLQDLLVEAFGNLAAPNEFQASTHASRLVSPSKVYGYATSLPFLSLDQSAIEDIRNLLAAILQSALRSKIADPDTTAFALGAGFTCYMNTARFPQDIDLSLWTVLCAHGHEHVSLSLFLQGLHDYVEGVSSLVRADGNTLQPLIGSLSRNLSGPSHTLRLLSLRILNQLHKLLFQSNADSLVLAVSIEETPVTIDTIRTLSMNIRALSTKYSHLDSAGFVRTAMARFCCGILHQKASQIEKDAHAALKVIADTDDGEQEIAEVAFSWLEDQPESPDAAPGGAEKAADLPSPADYEDAYLKRLQLLARQVADELDHAPDIMSRNFKEAHARVPAQAQDARSMACQLLGCVPALAERRSRHFVPLFLNRSSREDHSLGFGSEDPGSRTEEGPDDANGSRWSKQEQKLMLNIFARFKNPKALYQSSEVYATLLGFLANGDVELQKPALEAILAWKSPKVMPYKDKLRGILDESCFRDELTGFMQDIQNQSQMGSEDRGELMPLALRLLYGRAVARTGAANRNRSLESKRRLILKSLAEATVEELRLFVHVAITPLDRPGLLDGPDVVDRVLRDGTLPAKRQLGILNMIEDMLHVLGQKLTPLAENLLEAVIYCLLKASPARTDDPIESLGLSDRSQNAISKFIRQSGYQCLHLMFVRCIGVNWKSRLESLFQGVINPRMDKLPTETAHAPSGILKVFLTWSSSIDTVFFLSDYHGGLLATVSECLVVNSAKDEVKMTVLRILKNILDLVDEAHDTLDALKERVKMEMIQPNILAFITRLGTLLRTCPARPVLEPAIETLARLAPFTVELHEIHELLEILVYLFQQPARIVNFQIKSSLLRSLEAYLPMCRIQDDDVLRSKIFKTVACLFDSFRDRQSRNRLSHTIELLANDDPHVQKVARLCHDLNSFSVGRLDEPDFDRRVKAYEAINANCLEGMSLQYWRPILYNLLFYLRDDGEFIFRTNASHSLRQFLRNQSFLEQEETTFVELINRIIVPALQKGIRHESESVRAEHVNVMAEVVRSFPSIEAVNGLDVLLVGGDEEASFFNNILHIQQHRRIRALRRLAAEAAKGHLGGTKIRQFLLPLVEHFIFQTKDDESMHNLAAEAVSTVGVLVEWIEWRHYKSYLRKILGHFEKDGEPERVVLKLLAAVADALGRATATRANNQTEARNDVENGKPDDQVGNESMELLPISARSRLSTSLPSGDKLAEELTSKGFLPSLSAFLRKKDDSVVSLRSVAAIGCVKLVKTFPLEQLSVWLPPVLTEVCHVLRSRAPESRDMARKTLAEIATLLGPDCLAFILKELRGALTRGYQLHVLSFTVHSVLVAITPNLEAGALDYCLPQIIQVIMDDTFGTVGEEKDAEGYVSSMKEVKNSKSYDSMELITRNTTARHLSSLVKPVQAVLQQNLTLSFSRKVDELLRRVALGIAQNTSVQNQELLVFCYDLLAQALPTSLTGGQAGRAAAAPRRGITATKTSSASQAARSGISHGYKIARFALDVLRDVLRKQDALRTASNITGLVPVINDCLLSSQEEVKLSALRLLLVIIRVPALQLDNNLSAYISEAVHALKAAPTTNSELAQAAVKLITAILRERRDVHIDANDIKAQVTYLLQRLVQDIEEPSRQGATFSFLRAVMARKILVPEVYEVMDKVSSIMVRSHGREARDLARGVYIDFLMEYPQGKDRFAKQLAFLVKNLEYQYPEGRRCILEIIHFLFFKVGENLVQDILATFMVPLVMVLVNDESSECREMAGVLIKQLFERANDEKTRLFLASLRKWIDQDETPLLTRAALQCYASYFESRSAEGRRHVPMIQLRLQELLREARAADAAPDWEVAYFSLRLLLKFCQLYPDVLFGANAATTWTSIAECLSFPHNWVKLCAANLFGSYFADLSRSSSESDTQRLPLAGSHGLELEDNMIATLTKKHVHILETRPLGQELATQVVRNLVFLGRCLAANEPKSPIAKCEAKGVDPDDSDETSTSMTDDETAGQAPAIQRLFARVSRILRQDLDAPRKASLVPKMAALQLIAALCTQLSPDTLVPSLPTILVALHQLTDPSISEPRSSEPDFASEYKALRSTAHEVMELLQKNVGVSELTRHHNQARESIKEKREERRRKRRIEAVTDPDRALRHKRKKEDRKKVKRKERALEHRGRRRGW